MPIVTGPLLAVVVHLRSTTRGIKGATKSTSSNLLKLEYKLIRLIKPPAERYPNILFACKGTGTNEFQLILCLGGGWGKDKLKRCRGKSGTRGRPKYDLNCQIRCLRGVHQVRGSVCEAQQDVPRFDQFSTLDNSLRTSFFSPIGGK